MDKTEEELRLDEDLERRKNWKRWGPYLAERQWATVREDYSPFGKVWESFPHDHARSRAYRWGEDGLLGITDRECRLCFALALWNEKDPILKERLFGLTEKEGNHGEDVKEAYFYLDSTPTHSYMKALYKYPQKAFPYDQLVEENKKRGLQDSEYEILDTGIFDDNRYFDVFLEYAKNGPDDLLIKVTVHNRGPEKAPLHLLPQLWFRNTWRWEGKMPPEMHLEGDTIVANHETLGRFDFVCEQKPLEILFTENETNQKRLYHVSNHSPFVKDAFHKHVISKKTGKVNPKNTGTKSAPHYRLEIDAGDHVILKFRLYSHETAPGTSFGAGFDEVFEVRRQEADAFYAKVIPETSLDEEKAIARQAYAGLLWTKQFYHYIVSEWLEGDPGEPTPPQERLHGRNHDWTHLFASDIISMPDKWEYPWFAAWDLAFHMIPFCKLDPAFAKAQMILFTREWYMHPNGQQPAYEFALDDVNPPVHAWACWRIYKMTGAKGHRDRTFLESAFQKLLFNFTWWLNRKDLSGHNLFSGGFLGLDNIGVFNRSKSFPSGAILEQADGTAWMAFYCLTMLSMALELAVDNPVYEDMASKFFEHFIRIADSMNTHGGFGLWDPDDGFYYDQLKQEGTHTLLKTRSLVGLIPLLAVEILEEEKIEKLPGFSKRMKWFLDHRKDLEMQITYCKVKKEHGHRILAIPSKVRLERILQRVLDEEEFLSPFGIRSLSKFHSKSPYTIRLGNEEHTIEYAPGED